MRKLQLKATELVDTDVNFVSLVERGANRIPFRIIKEEEQMLDLHKIGRSLFRKAEPKPEIVAVITQKGADPEKVLEVIKTAGLDPTEFMATEKDGILTFAKTDADKAEGTMVVRVNETVGVVVSGLQKAFDGFEFSSTSFSDVMASGSFCSSVCTATDMLNATIGNILAYAESADQAADEINKAVGEYQSYVVTLAKGLPVHAFKADVAFTRTSLAAGPAPAASPEVTAEVTESATETVPEPVETAKSETNEEEVEKTKDRMEEVEAEKPNEKQPDDSEKTAHVPESAEADDAVTDSAGADQPGHTELLAAIAELRKTLLESGSAEADKSGQFELLAAIAEMQKTFAAAAMAMKEDVKEQVNELTTRVDLVATLAQKTDAALNGTVFNEAGGDRPGRIAKTAFPSTPPLLDTAYNRRSAAYVRNANPNF